MSYFLLVPPWSGGGLDRDNIFPLLYGLVMLLLINIAAINLWWHMASLQPPTRRTSQPASQTVRFEPQSAAQSPSAKLWGGGPQTAGYNQTSPLWFSRLCLFSFGASVFPSSFSSSPSGLRCPFIVTIKKIMTLTQYYRESISQFWAGFFSLCGGLWNVFVVLLSIRGKAWWSMFLFLFACENSKTDVLPLCSCLKSSSNTFAV